MREGRRTTYARRGRARGDRRETDLRVDAYLAAVILVWQADEVGVEALAGRGGGEHVEPLLCELGELDRGTVDAPQRTHLALRADDLVEKIGEVQHKLVQVILQGIHKPVEPREPGGQMGRGACGVACCAVRLAECSDLEQHIERARRDGLHLPARDVVGHQLDPEALAAAERAQVLPLGAHLQWRGIT